MSDPVRIELERQMAEAVGRDDFEEAARLRDEIRKLAEGSGFRRQGLDEMGIGTDQQVLRPPKGWKPPPKPDPMTRGHKPGKRRR